MQKLISIKGDTILVSDEDYYDLLDKSFCYDNTGFVKITHDNTRLHLIIADRMDLAGEYIIHKNGNKLDNRRSNLEAVSKTKYRQITNMGRGIRPRGNKYQAYIWYRKQYHLGTFDNEQDAQQAYTEAKEGILNGTFLKKQKVIHG